MDNGHDSDCATHNAPAYPAGPCDCMPTQAMCRAAVVYLNGADVYDKLPREVLEIEESIYAEVWKAMQAAGPANAEIEARAAELHEGCQMPMEQARDLAASEASPDWYARGQDWGLADALTNGQSGDWVLDDIARAFAAGAAAKTTMKVEISSDPEMVRRAMAAETETALLRAALDQKHAEYEDLQRHGNNTAHNLARMQAALAENASRSANYLRKAIKWEARAAELATDAQRYHILRNCNMDVRNRLEHYGGDALDERLDALNSLALGPNRQLGAIWRMYERKD